MSGTAMGPGREFDLIRRLVRGWGDRAVGIGDDAAILRVPEGARLVVTTDTAVERVHFRRDWCSPNEIGYRATVAAVSDLAAMAAAPLGLLVALAIPEVDLTMVDALADGIGEAAGASGTVIVGGNVTRAGELSLTTTALGHTVQPLVRSGARPGQVVYVTGRFGGPAAAVASWLAGTEPNAEWRARYVQPRARIAEGQWLARHGATAAIDVSDGLLADLEHVATASRVDIEVALDQLPLISGVELERAARGGDEYELAATGPPDLDREAFRAEFGIPLTPIGSVTVGEPSLRATLHGVRVAPGGGWNHFS
jgi:thiamine-monophosphate kinase